ncbi:MAG TPA: response regulator transcription factor [Solirubrobacteraceae bacterium]
MIAVLLAEDQAMVRGALATLLDLEPDISVIAQAGRGDEALALVREQRPDVALVDIEMPGLTGLEVAERLRDSPTKVVIVTTFGRPGYLRRAMEAGAAGFLLKDAPPEVLADAIRRVAAGEHVIDPDLAVRALAEGQSPLTAREREVLAATLVHGTIADLATALHLSQGTVRNHLSAAIQKLGVRTRGEAVRVAEERGWL